MTIRQLDGFVKLAIQQERHHRLGRTQDMYHGAKAGPKEIEKYLDQFEKDA